MINVVSLFSQTHELSLKKKRKAPTPAGIPEFVVVTDLLDLHGFSPEQIPEVVDEFVRNAVELKLERLQIIHGKGKSRLKYLVRKQLQQNPFVVAFRDAAPESGGWGRTVILLKRDEPPDAG